MNLEICQIAEIVKYASYHKEIISRKELINPFCKDIYFYSYQVKEDILYLSKPKLMTYFPEMLGCTCDYRADKIHMYEYCLRSINKIFPICFNFSINLRKDQVKEKIILLFYFKRLVLINFYSISFTRKFMKNLIKSEKEKQKLKKAKLQIKREERRKIELMNNILDKKTNESFDFSNIFQDINILELGKINDTEGNLNFNNLGNIQNKRLKVAKMLKDDLLNSVQYSIYIIKKPKGILFNISYQDDSDSWILGVFGSIYCFKYKEDYENFNNFDSRYVIYF